MLSSSLEYLQALRKGEYLLFLEWTTFVQKKYAREGDAFDADTLMDCFIFEWLAAGFNDKDIEPILIVYGVRANNPLMQFGYYSYSLTQILSVLFACLAVHSNKSEDSTLVYPQTKMTYKQVQKFIKEQVIKTDAEKFSEQTGLMQNEFMKRVEKPSKAEIIKIKAACENGIDEFVEFFSLWEAYAEALEEAQKGDDFACSVRLEIVRRFLDFLKGQTKLNDVVRYEMSIQVTSLRAQHPSSWEEEQYLQKVSPTTVVDKAVKVLASCVYSFFSLISSSEVSDETPKKESALT